MVRSGEEETEVIINSLLYDIETIRMQLKALEKQMRIFCFSSFFLALSIICVNLTLRGY